METKKKFKQIMKEATKEFEEEKTERVKKKIKEVLQEYEMAKAIISRIEKQMKQIEKGGIDEAFLLEYDDS